MNTPADDIKLMYDALASSWARIVIASRAKDIEVAAAYEAARSGRGAGPGQDLLLEAERLRHLKEAERAKLDEFLQQHLAG